MTATPSDTFSSMAVRILHNASAKFGGAAVIIPPSGDGAIEVFMMDEATNDAFFWQTIDMRIKTTLAELDDKRRQQQAFGIR